MSNTTYAILGCAILLVSFLLIIYIIYTVHSIPINIAEKGNHPQKKAIKAMAISGLFIFPFLLLAYIWANIIPTKKD
jgi:Na+/H+ antiporter NhaD/arsenite permease-like protein